MTGVYVNSQYVLQRVLILQCLANLNAKAQRRAA